MKNEKRWNDGKKYFVGLDIGTDSVGYAVTDEQYKPVKFNGEPMWGTHLIDATAESAARRGFRTTRRRLDRRQQRVNFIRGIFADEISKIDDLFYKRLNGSALFAEDKETPSKNSFFNDVDYQDREYHKEYPTIHHLICALMNGTAKRDVRLVYLAVAYLVAHRGHFLNEVDKDDIEGVLDFGRIYNEFLSYFETPIWNCDIGALSEILKKKTGVKAKEKELLSLIFDGKKPKATDEDTYDRAAMLTLLAGGKVKPQLLFLNDAYAEISSICLSMKDEEFDAVISELGDDGELLVHMKKLFDWSILADLTPNGKMISETKIDVFEQHKKDLRFLKAFIRKYLPNKYFEVFRSSKKDLKNYVAYSYNIKNAREPEVVEEKASKYEFCEYLLKLVKGIEVEECDARQYEDMIDRLDKDTALFMPKQVDGDNRVIPYQLYYAELVKILDSAKTWLAFLNVADSNGITPYEKIIATFLYRIPYYVGPLNKALSQNAWVVRDQGKIYPWNFEQMVDLDKSEEAFISRMTNQCTYLPGENVLPKNSLLYTKFEVLNEINNLKVNGNKIDVETKQFIYANCFEKIEKVTPKRIRDALICAGKIKAEDVISGIDISMKSSLKSYLFFKSYLENGILKEKDVEDILSAKAYSEDSFRFKRWLSAKYPQLSEFDVKRIGNQKFKEFGRLSEKFLKCFEGTSKDTGETFTIIDALWNTNYNLMQLLSDEFTFREKVEEYGHEYYVENPKSLSERISDMYIPTAVKRPVIRTLDIIKDIVKAQGCAPTKIFVEMARGADEDQKNKRTTSRRDQILEFYKSIGDTDEIRALKEQLAGKEDRELRGEALYLYFIQCGKCMYSGRTIDISDLGSGTYNIDHIYPRSFVKDDSVSNNKVLVLSKINADKLNDYPIAADIRNKMYTFWKTLHEKGLITDEKFKRLTRSTPFTEEEKWGFINRQLVETRQSTKAISTLLKEMYPKTEIVYVKAGLVSEFRHAFEMLKSRSVNDLHHAKDAYLNIVVGNVYNSVFTKRWFNPNTDKYSLKAEIFFSKTYKPGGVCVWEGAKSIDLVRGIMAKNNIHLTKYAFCRHGGFFAQQPVKAGTNNMLVPRKKGLDPAKYGGYNKTTASFFILVKYEVKKKTDLAFMPVEWMYADKFMTDSQFALEYTEKTLAGIINHIPCNIEFPLGMRKIKINTVLELDGFRVFISGKGDGGGKILVSSLTSLIIGGDWERYIKRLESFAEKQKSNPGIHVSTKHDGIDPASNVALYDIYLQKSRLPYFNKTLCSSISSVLEKGRDAFVALSMEEQVKALLNIGSVFKTGRKGGCDLRLIEGTSTGGSLKPSSRVSNWKKTYATAYIIDSSASGLHESRSVNLLDLL